MDKDDRDHFDELAGASASLPPRRAAPRRRSRDEFRIRPNVFVPCDNRIYPQCYERAGVDPDSVEAATRVCFDGVTRDGLWVPLSWLADHGSVPQ